MSNGAKSILGYGIYLIGLGATLTLVPNIPLAIFGLPAPQDYWIRILGLTAMFLGYYFIRAARSEFTPFFDWTLAPRSLIVIAFVVFVVIGIAPVNLLLLAPPDIVFSLWTYFALRADKTRMQPAHA